MSSGCLDDLQVLKASENKRDGALQSDPGFTLTGDRVPRRALVGRANAEGS